MPPNIYFDLTDAFNADGRIAILTSGQAVVHYRLSLMSKDGDWIVRENEEACRRIRGLLAERGARYRPGAPLDPRWLAGGWSSHFEFPDHHGRRIRCDFFSRPPRLSYSAVTALFETSKSSPETDVIDVPSLIKMKRTQRAKDYPIIGELARLLPPKEELELTTDPDRILELAQAHGERSDRPAVRATLENQGRLAVVQALAVEVDGLQQEDRQRVERYAQASEHYLLGFRQLERQALLLPESHEILCELAERLLPKTVTDDGQA